MLRYFTLLLITLTPSLSAQWKNGDIIFSKTKGTQAIAVEAATNSAWTHTAVIYLKGSTPMVFEAVQPVQIITLEAYLKRSGSLAKHKFKRLKDPTLFDDATLTKALAWAKKHVGKNYDGKFQWSDNTLYCSELVWKIYKECADIELCKVNQVKDYNLEHPKVKSLIKARFGSVNRLNKEEKVVAPSDIYESKFLEEFHPFKKSELQVK